MSSDETELQVVYYCFIILCPMGICEMFGKGMETAPSPVDTISDLFTIHLTHIC